MRRIRTLLLEVGLILLAIVLGRVFDSPIGYCAAGVLAIGFIFAWFIGRDDDDESDSADRCLFAGGTSDSPSSSVDLPNLILEAPPAPGRYIGKFDFVVRNVSDDAVVNVTVPDVRLPVPESVKQQHRIGQALIRREAEEGQPEWVVQFFHAGVHAHVAVVPARESRPLAYRVNGIGPVHGQDLAGALAACGEGSDFSFEMLVEFSDLGTPIRRWQSRSRLTYDHVLKSICVQHIETLHLDGGNH